MGEGGWERGRPRFGSMDGWMAGVRLARQEGARYNACVSQSVSQSNDSPILLPKISNLVAYVYVVVSQTKQSVYYSKAIVRQ